MALPTFLKSLLATLSVCVLLGASGCATQQPMFGTGSFADSQGAAASAIIHPSAGLNQQTTPRTTVDPPNGAIGSDCFT